MWNEIGEVELGIAVWDKDDSLSSPLFNSLFLNMQFVSFDLGRQLTVSKYLTDEVR